MTDQTTAPCRTLGEDAHNQTCPFCGALPQAPCRHVEDDEAEGDS